jgi:DHA1 family bicyclomycin/chloramphenicol resistance-like MFS transporter
MTVSAERPQSSLVLILGSLSAIPPLAIDMYLPALPVIAGDLASDEGSIQFSLMAFFAGLMLGQLFYGPLADRYGRKPLLYFGLTLFVAASLGCAFAGTARDLSILRFVQGLGGSVGMVMSFAIVRDLYTGLRAGHLLSLVVMVLGVTPIVAPLFGSVIIAITSWRMIFLVQGVMAAILLVFVARYLPETRSVGLRRQTNPAAILRNYGGLLVNKRYIPFVLAVSVAQAGFFAYLSASAPIFIATFGLSPFAFSVAFALNAFGMMAGARSSAVVLRKFRAGHIVRIALAVYLVSALVLLAMSMAGALSLLPFAAALLIIITALGFIMPLGSMLAMESVGPIAGTAAALMGAFQFGFGALSSAAMGAFSDGSAFPMAACIFVCALVATSLSVLAFPKNPTEMGMP